MLIAIADRAGRSFPIHAHTNGFAHWKSGAVTIEQESERSVTAKVRGQRIRDVVLREEKGCLVIQCSCPGRSMDLPGCKHAWATVLEVDRRGALSSLRTTRDPLKVAFAEEVEKKEMAKEATEDETIEKKPIKKKKPKPVKAPEAVPSDRASPRSARATSAPPAKRGKPQRRPPRASSRRR
jgi:uncharacterized Zn finger protein